ncbi:MAG: transposase [Nitrosomonadaceae bacterium]
MAKRKIYTDKFIYNACLLVTHDGMSVADASKKVKVHHTMMRKWINKAKKGSIKAAVVKESTLVSELESRIQMLQNEIDILEKARDILR